MALSRYFRTVPHPYSGTLKMTWVALIKGKHWGLVSNTRKEPKEKPFKSAFKTTTFILSEKHWICIGQSSTKFKTSTVGAMVITLVDDETWDMVDLSKKVEVGDVEERGCSVFISRMEVDNFTFPISRVVIWTNGIVSTNGFPVDFSSEGVDNSPLDVVSTNGLTVDLSSDRVDDFQLGIDSTTVLN